MGLLGGLGSALGAGAKAAAGGMGSGMSKALGGVRAVAPMGGGGTPVPKAPSLDPVATATTKSFGGGRKARKPGLMSRALGGKR